MCFLPLSLTLRTQEKNWYLCPYVSNSISLSACPSDSLIISSDNFFDLNYSTALIYSGSCKFHHRFIVSARSYAHGQLHPPFHRYSNTLLVSLNNRIAIRDSDDARGGFVDCQVVTSFRGSAFLEATKSVTLVPERPPKFLKKQPVPAVEIEESLNSES